MERAAAMHGFVEWLVARALADAGLIPAGLPWSAPQRCTGNPIAGFVEWLVARALADAGLIPPPDPEGP